MGQEWAASSPFLYFTEHDEPLGAAIAEGRREEFKRFGAFSDPELRRRIPDPQAPGTSLRSKLAWEERGSGEHARVLDLYQRLLALRRSDLVLQNASRTKLTATASGAVLVVRRTAAGSAPAVRELRARAGRMVSHPGSGVTAAVAEQRRGGVAGAGAFARHRRHPRRVSTGGDRVRAPG